jgi:predicted transcriptional regulator
MNSHYPPPSVNFVLRSLLQVQMSPELKKRIKQIALEEDKTVRAVVLEALAQRYPKLDPFVSSELKNSK